MLKRTKQKAQWESGRRATDGCSNCEQMNRQAVEFEQKVNREIEKVLENFNYLVNQLNTYKN